MSDAFLDGYVKTVGPDINKVLPPMSMFAPGRTQKRVSVLDKLKAFFNKFFDIANSSMNGD